MAENFDVIVIGGGPGGYAAAFLGADLGLSTVLVDTAHPSLPSVTIDDIAGVVNAAGNVMGLMPHPEDAVDPQLGGTDGATLLVQSPTFVINPMLVKSSLYDPQREFTAVTQLGVVPMIFVAPLELRLSATLATVAPALSSRIQRAIDTAGMKGTK